VYADDGWLISRRNRENLKQVIKNSVNRPLDDEYGSRVSLNLKVVFKREASDFLTASYEANKTLDYTNYYDCVTGKELRKFSELDCDGPEAAAKNDGVYMVFKQALIPNLVLGNQPSASPVTRAGHEGQESHDIALSYTCESRTW